MTTIQQATQLINLAKSAINEGFSGEPLKLTTDIKKNFAKEQGVFITLKKDGELRGCIGFPLPTYPLYQAVIEAARSAAKDIKDTARDASRTIRDEARQEVRAARDAAREARDAVE